MRNLVTQPSSPRGFSLIELVLVVTILGVLAGLVIPAFSGRSELSHLESNGLRVAALARMASSYALNQGRTVRLELYSHPSELRFGVADGNYPLAEDYVDLPADWARPYTLTGKTTFAETQYYGEESCVCLEAQHVFLYPDGSAQSLQVRMTSPDGDTLALAVSRSTGRIDVLRLWEEEE